MSRLLLRAGLAALVALVAGLWRPARPATTLSRVNSVELDELLSRPAPADVAALAALPVPFRDIDLLINNAGLALGTAPAQSASLDQWNQMIETNITGLVTLTHKLVSTLIARKLGETTLGVYAAPAYLKRRGRPRTVADLADIPIKVVNNATIYLRDVANVRDGFGVQTNIVRRDGRRARRSIRRARRWRGSRPARDVGRHLPRPRLPTAGVVGAALESRSGLLCGHRSNGHG